MNKIDFNKVLLSIGVILILTFIVTLTYDYVSYNTYDNSAPFYTYILVRFIEFGVLGLLCIYLYSQNTNLKETVYDIKVSKNFSVNRYKIAQISDFHNTNSTRLKLKIIESLKNTKPNIIVITGDLIDSRRTNIAGAKEFLENITTIAKTYCVLGNHESRKENIQELIKIFESTGVIVLRNETVKLKDNLELIGLEDINFSIPENEQENLPNSQTILKQTLKQNLENIVTQNDTYKILITHRPEYISTYSECNIDLALTGHAHGGQVRLPFIGGIIAPGQGIFPKYTKGIHTKNNTTMIVSRGIGNSKFPLRFNNRPEIIFVNIL